MGKRIIRSIVFVCFSIGYCYSVGPKYCARLLSVTLWNDYDYINFTIAAQTINASIRYNFTLDLKKDTPNCIVQLEGYVESKGRKQLLVNKAFDICNVFSGNEVDLLAVLFLMPFRQIKTLPNKCPIRRGFYYAYGVYMDTSQYPAVLPSATFTVKIKLMFKQNNGMKTVFKGAVVGHAMRVSRRKSCPD